MEHTNRKLIRIKEKDLATVDKRTSERRSMLQRELATLDDRAEQERGRLEQEIRVLQQAAQIEEQTLIEAKAPVKVYTKQEREELFNTRRKVMWQALMRANGREVHAKDLGVELDRPASTVKDYYGEQLELRPQDCFWEFGVDKAHFRWKGGVPPPNGMPAAAAPQVATPTPDNYWLTGNPVA